MQANESRWGVSGNTLLGDLSTSKPNSLLTEKEYLFVSQIFLLIAMTIAMFGSFTNSINIVTFVSMGVDDGVTTVFLAMAVSDLIFVLLVFVRNFAFLLHTIERSVKQWWFPVDPVAMFLFSGLVGKMAFTTTALLSTFMAVARCMCVVKPLHFRSMFHKGRCMVAILFCALFPVAVQIPNLANMGIKPRYSIGQNASRPALWFSPDRERIKDIVRLILDTILLILTEFVVVICVLIMTSTLKKAASIRNNLQADSSTMTGAMPSSVKLTGKDLQVIKQIVIISTIYIVCNISKICHCIVDITDSRFDFGKPFYNMFMALIHVNTVFATLNSTLNFFVYFNFNTKFRSVCILTKLISADKLSKKGFEEE